MVMVTDDCNTPNHLIKHGCEYAAVDDTGVALVTAGHCVITANFIFAVIVEMHVKPAGVLPAADKTMVRVGLFIHIVCCFYQPPPPPPPPPPPDDPPPPEPEEEPGGEEAEEIAEEKLLLKLLPR